MIIKKTQNVKIKRVKTPKKKYLKKSFLFFHIHYNNRTPMSSKDRTEDKTCSDHLQTQTSLSIFIEQEKICYSRKLGRPLMYTHNYIDSVLLTKILLFYFTTLTVVQHRTILLEMTPFHSHVHTQTCHVDGGMTVVFIFMLFFSMSFLSHYTLYCVSLFCIQFTYFLSCKDPCKTHCYKVKFLCLWDWENKLYGEKHEMRRSIL